MKVSNLFLDNWILIVYLYNEIKYRIKDTIGQFDFWKARNETSSRKGIYRRATAFTNLPPSPGTKVRSIRTTKWY